MNYIKDQANFLKHEYKKFCTYNQTNTNIKFEIPKKSFILYVHITINTNML